MESINSVANKAQELIDKENAQNPDIRKILKIVREFIETHRVMCYGGTAINNLLPEKQRFYDPEKDVPDYDFFSETPELHSAKIADRLVKAGYSNIEVKPGTHLGTFKVFANYNGVADVSHLDRNIFEKLWKESIEKDKIHYVPPNFLRMSMYLELSRPKGMVSRWPKVYQRLQLLNKEYPIKCNPDKTEDKYITNETRKEIESILIKENGVLLGFNAAMLQTENTKWISPLDIICTPDKREKLVKEFVRFFGKVKTKDYPAYEELFPSHTDILEGNTLLMRIYEADACHSYHKNRNGLFIASIPTILQFIFSTLYAPKHFFENFSEDRYICNAEHLVGMKGSFKYKTLTPITCLGKQKTLGDMREERSKLYEKYSKDKSSAKFISNFFMYSPSKLSKTQRAKLRKTLNKTLKKSR